MNGKQIRLKEETIAKLEKWKQRKIEEKNGQFGKYDPKENIDKIINELIEDDGQYEALYKECYKDCYK